MDAFIRLVPGWDNLVLGVQLGIWVSLLAIFLLGLVARLLVIFLFCAFMQKKFCWTEKNFLRRKILIGSLVSRNS